MQLSVEEKAELAEVYEKAAEYLENYGWRQGTEGKHGEPRCVLGALASADPGRVLVGRAREFLKRVLELEPNYLVLQWNDEDGRTEDEVINTLHALANKLR